MSVHTFTFGEPVPMLDRSQTLDYLECWAGEQWYEPPLSWAGLAQSFRASTHHSSAIFFKRNALVSAFIPHPWLSRANFSRFVLDFLIFGNA